MFDICLTSLIMKVRGQISVYSGGSLIFGLSDYPISEFELVAEELLLSDSIIKVPDCDSKCFSVIILVPFSIDIGATYFELLYLRVVVSTYNLTILPLIHEGFWCI